MGLSPSILCSSDSAGAATQEDAFPFAVTDVCVRTVGSVQIDRVDKPCLGFSTALSLHNLIRLDLGCRST